MTRTTIKNKRFTKLLLYFICNKYKLRNNRKFKKIRSHKVLTLIDKDLNCIKETENINAKNMDRLFNPDFFSK